MIRPRRQIYPLGTYLSENKEGDISNDVDTQRKPAWKSIVSGLIVTVLTDDYIPPIILGEDKNEKKHILDGGSRTAALMMFKYGNYKISSSVEDAIISYKKKMKDENGNDIFEDVEFNLKNKTYDQLPEELKKRFDNYQLETVIYDHCSKEMTAKYIKRFNEHTSMNASQKGFTYINNFADKICKIMNSSFFINCSVFSDSDKDKGVIERSIMETMMCMNHFDNWKTQPKSAFKYLNDNATEEEFDVLTNNLHRLENIITFDIVDIFNKKDSFIFLTLFDKFTKLGIDDIQFANFLKEFKYNLRELSKNEKDLMFDEIDKGASTKDKQVVSDKLNMLENLMLEFLHNDEVQEGEVLDNTGIVITENESFIADVLNMDLDKVIEGMEVYNDTLNDLTDKTIRDGSKLLNEENRKSLLAMVAYSYERDIDLDEWLAEYAKSNNTYFSDQKKNFIHMRDDFEKFLINENRKSA